MKTTKKNVSIEKTALSTAVSLVSNKELEHVMGGWMSVGSVLDLTVVGSIIVPKSDGIDALLTQVENFLANNPVIKHTPPDQPIVINPLKPIDQQ